MKYNDRDKNLTQKFQQLDYMEVMEQLNDETTILGCHFGYISVWILSCINFMNWAPQNRYSKPPLLRTTVPFLTSGTPSDFGIMPPLIPVVKILEKNLGSLGKFGRKWGSNF